jgi:hypothetical protein
MKYAYCLAAGLLISAPAFAQTVSATPQAEMSSGSQAAPTQAERREALAAAQLPAPNGAGDVIPNGTVTANPAGAGASSSATLTDHGEISTSDANASTNAKAKASVNQ